MIDIVRRLRHLHWPNIPDTQEAANEIERLRAELAAEREAYLRLSSQTMRLKEDNANLREALEEFNFYLLFDSDSDNDTRPVLVRHIRRARAVLEETGGRDE